MSEAPNPEWRRVPISPYRSYEVSSDGQVRRDGRVLKGYVDRYGYRTLLLYYAGLSKRHKVHRLVCEAFHGSAPDGTEAAHIDGSKLNNSAENLCWATRSENTRHQVRHGTFAGSKNLVPGQPRGEANPTAKLTNEVVREIRRKAAAGQSGRSIAREYGLNQPHVAKIIRGEAWSHLSGAGE